MTLKKANNLLFSAYKLRNNSVAKCYFAYGSCGRYVGGRPRSLTM